jgi:hypothetical protein
MEPRGLSPLPLAPEELLGPVGWVFTDSHSAGSGHGLLTIPPLR